MLRSSLYAASAFALMAGATAQTTPLTATAEKITGAVKHAGTYHVATGTWTRNSGQTANVGPDVVYSNTAQTGYYFNTFNYGDTSEHIDEGAIPGSNNFNHPAANRDEYNVNCVDMAYCDFGAAGTGGWELAFYNNYDLCRGVATPDSLVDAGGLPANGCWTVQLDLTGTPVCILADGGDGFDDDPDLDSFGWSLRYNGTDVAANRGPFIAGDPMNTDPNWITGGLPEDGSNTYYGAASLCTGGGVNGGPAGSGYLSGDAWWAESLAGATNAAGCYFFGGYINNNGCGGAQGNSYGSFYMELAADTGTCMGGPGRIDTTFCTSLPNSTGVNSMLMVTGSDSAAANDVQLVATVSPNSFGYFITSQTMVTPNPVGAGLICLGGNIGRFSVAGQIKQADANGDGITLDTTTGEWSLAGIPTSTGPYTAAAGITTFFQCWHRDSVMGSLVSNFTDGSAVTWTP